jgi:phosphatidylserine decarboxylase
MPNYYLVALALSLATALPLAWKWVLGIGRSAIAVAAISLGTSALIEPASRWLPLGGRLPDVLVKAGTSWLLTLAAAFALLVWRFFRDPERTVPADPNAIVSPADGTVLYVRQSRDGSLPVSTKAGRSYTLLELTKTPLQMNEAVVIGVGMNFLDVHVNRAPIAGVIAARQHFRGLFGSLREPEMVFRNERMTTIIQRGDLQVAVVQIASRLVRQICSFVRDAEEVALGQRIGMIRFGSQVDLVMPLRRDLEVMVKPGDKLTAGQSIVAVLRAPIDEPRTHEARHDGAM